MEERIVVGTDGSAAAERALAWAVDEARLRDATLVVVRAWSFLEQEAPFDPSYGEEAVRELLASSLKTLDLDGITVERQTPCDHASAALIDASSGASLVVVGARGRGGFASLLLGSVSLQVVTHAHCPVAVVR